MTARKWMPSAYMDESVPPARATPSDWIVKLDDGTPALAPGDPYGDDDGPGRPLTEGETVKFDWTEHYGRRDLTFHKSDDGWQWTLHGDEPEAPPDGDMNVAAVGDWESMMPSLEEFATEYACNGADDDETVPVVFYAWSRRPVPFVFRGGVFCAVGEVADVAS